MSKSASYDEISFKKCFGELYDPLESFLMTWKLLKLLLFHKRRPSPISVLPCFSKILERIIYNRKYLQEMKIIYP